jgi:hypothetical protein
VFWLNENARVEPREFAVSVVVINVIHGVVVVANQVKVPGAVSYTRRLALPLDEDNES